MMHDPKLIEAMARAIAKRHSAKAGGCFAPTDIPEQPDDCAEGTCYCAKTCKRDATAALTSLCAARPDVAAVLAGEAVVVPREAHDDMLDAWGEELVHIVESGPEGPVVASSYDSQVKGYRAMLAANPYAAKETRDAR